MKRFLISAILFLFLFLPACAKKEEKPTLDVNSILQRGEELREIDSRQRVEISAMFSEYNSIFTRIDENDTIWFSTSETTSRRQTESETQSPIQSVTEEPALGGFEDPGCPVVPEYGPGSATYIIPPVTEPRTTQPKTTAPPATEPAPKCWTGVDPYRPVYVSSRSCTVHDSSTCSGMKYYSTMQAYEAYAKGYKRCGVCW